MKKTVAIILAAGRGTRMKSDTPKVLHEVLGRPIISHVIDAVEAAGIDEVVTVIGYGKELLEKAIGDRTRLVVQKELRGSGDAVKTARRLLGARTGDVLVICGDTPLVRSESIRRVIATHQKSAASATVLTVSLPDPSGYGRIIRDADGRVAKIVEEKDADFTEKAVNEINVGTYCFDARDLFAALGRVRPDNEKKEYYLTDTIAILLGEGKRVEAVVTEDRDEIIGVNTRRDLAAATRIMQQQVHDSLMDAGVTIQDPATTTIYPGARIGRDTTICPHTFIGPDVEIGSHCQIGPFARLTAHVRIGEDVVVGNFVELVRTTIGDGVRVKHHTYLGDTTVGRKVNIGAGTITANYDGKHKNRTQIGDGAFIGVGAVLIAPVKVGKRALVGAGCVVPKNRHVPDGATVVGVPARMLHTKRS